MIEEIKTHNLEVYEIMWNNMVQPGRAQIIRRMRTACLVPKATNTHSEYVSTYFFSTTTMFARTRLSVTL